jgi:hypothetical protein
MGHWQRRYVLFEVCFPFFGQKRKDEKHSEKRDDENDQGLILA